MAKISTAHSHKTARTMKTATGSSAARSDLILLAASTGQLLRYLVNKSLV